jgi:hypothetical protein
MCKKEDRERREEIMSRMGANIESLQKDKAILSSKLKSATRKFGITAIRYERRIAEMEKRLDKKGKKK